jgi:hypothetical protein
LDYSSDGFQPEKEWQADKEDQAGAKDDSTEREGIIIPSKGYACAKCESAYGECPHRQQIP